VSDFEETIWAQLKEVFPNCKIVRQYYINYFGTALYFDFYLPAMNLLIECQGEQHYKYTQHFHGTKEAYRLSKQRDQLKREWVKINKVLLLEIKFDDVPKTSFSLFNRIGDLNCQP